jgi:hypothetical protein
MHTERILALADMLERRQLPEGLSFNMASFISDPINPGCGTTCCIAGHAVVLSKGLAYISDLYESSSNAGSVICRVAEDWLGLGTAVAGELFMPTLPGGMKWCEITPEMAAWTLRNLAATGLVVWRV